MRWLHQRLGACLSVLVATVVAVAIAQNGPLPAAGQRPSSRAPGAPQQSILPAGPGQVGNVPVAPANPKAPCDPGGGGGDSQNPGGKTVVPPRPRNALVARVIQVQNRHTGELLAIRGVVGVGTGLAQNGNVGITVFTELSNVGQIPALLEGVAVQVKKTGRFRKLQRAVPRPRPHTPMPSTHDFLHRPVPIGVSIAPDVAGLLGYGTLGCRVKDRTGQLYILSNNHVAANENHAPIGTAILQPGTYNPDTGSTGALFGDAQTIGYLSKFVTLVYNDPAHPNKVDAAIASCTAAKVGNTTLSNGYGSYHSTPVEAFLGQPVQKYGATSGYTRGYVAAVNATISVGGYDDGTGWFTGQIGILGRDTASFGIPGDSGSLVVSDSLESARRARPEAGYPVGLYFAGGGGWGFANRIQDVLQALDVTLDGSR